MKKCSMMLLSILLIFIFAGCSSDKEKATSDKKETGTTETNKEINKETKTTAIDTKHDHATDPSGPTAEDLCYFCNMKIYTKDEDMGVFTAQAIKEDGTHVFFDDSGCLLNAQRKYNEEFAKEWVRDYTNSDWIEADKAVVVKADVTTPMKYGYAFFKNEESANKYITENQTNGVISSWDPIDQEAQKRYEAKIKREAEAKAAGGTMQKSENMNMNK